MNGNDNTVPLATCDFEIAPYNCDLTGTIKAYAYEEKSDEAKTIVSTDENVTVKVIVTLKGNLLHHLCGKLCLCVYLESIGPAKEYQLPDPCHEIDLDPCGNGVYEFDCVIAAGTIEADKCGTLYILAVTLTSLDACGKPGHIAAYCKDACLMFYNPPHADDS